MTIELYTVADADYYAPLSALARRDPLLRPSDVPAGWTFRQSGLWVSWTPADADTRAGFRAAADDGQVGAASGPAASPAVSPAASPAVSPVAHAGADPADRADPAGTGGTAGDPADPNPALVVCVAAPAALADSALGVFAASCFARGIPFRHLATASILDQLAGPRGVPALADRFLTAFPPTPAARDELILNLAAEPRFESVSAAPTPRPLPRPDGLMTGPWDDSLLAGPLTPPARNAVPGVPLAAWIQANSPAADPDATPDDWERYYRRAGELAAQVRRRLGRSRAWADPGDVHVDRNGTVHLAAVQPDTSRPALDRVAFALLSPLGPVAEQSPDVLPHIHRDLAGRGPLPRALWRAATRDAVAGPAPHLPGPAAVARNDRAALADLRDRVAAGILAAADDAPEGIFPTVPHGYETSTLTVAYGTAGILHALRTAGVPVPDWIVERFRRDALRQGPALVPGFQTGLAGVAWVLAEFEYVDEARALLRLADRHPLLSRSATLAWGTSGVALAHLALYGHTDDEHHLARALALTRLPAADADLPALLGPHDPTGLWFGRSGVAHALQQVAAVSGTAARRRRASRILHAELARGVTTARHPLAFPVSARDHRLLPHLHSGSAGVLHAVARHLAADPAHPDERLAAALPELIRELNREVAAGHLPGAGLYQGLAGLGFALADTGRLLDQPAATAGARHAARALFQHAIPDRRGAAADPHGGEPAPAVRFLGDLRLRASCDLWSGSAGVLLFLTALLAPTPDPLFTVDRLAADRPAGDRAADRAADRAGAAAGRRQAVRRLPGGGGALRADLQLAKV